VFSEALMKHLRGLADSGLSLSGLTTELDRHRSGLRGEQYDELWLYCWALKRDRNRWFRPPTWNDQQVSYA
jgi:hypothetical protein